MPKKKVRSATEEKAREAARRKVVERARRKVAAGQQLTEEEASRWHDVCRLTLMRRRQRGEIRYFKIGSRIFYDDQMLGEDLRQAAITHQAERSAA